MILNRLNLRNFKNIIQKFHFKTLNNNIYNNSFINNIDFNNNNNNNNIFYKNNNFNLKFYSTINSKDININNDKDNINNKKENRDGYNNDNDNKEDNKESEEKDKDYYNSFKNDNSNREYREKKFKEKYENQFDFRAMAMLIVKLSIANYLIRYYFLDFTYCQGSSMQPTISSGAILIINRYTRDFKVNDLITAISPTTGDYNICKRIKFVEGDTILFHSETGSVIYTIPKGYVWIEGDNPSTSKDSRSYGPIPINLITGKVIIRLNPLSTLKNDPIPETETQKLN